MSYPEPLLQTEGYFSTTQVYSNILSCFKLGRSIHPLEPAAPDFSEFLDISSRRRVRVIHIRPDIEKDDEKPKKNDFAKGKTRRSFRLSTEEYWFTRWNRPMRNASSCNCSFRRSQRFSKYSDRLSFASNKEIVISDKRNSFIPDRFVSKEFYIENYAEKLICDILMAAFKEYAADNVRKESKISNGIVNLAYSKSNDQVDKAVLIEDLNNFLFNNTSYSTNDSNQSIKVQNNLSNISDCLLQVTPRKKKICNHETSMEKKTKPLVLLFHGIGSTADVWWDILECLVSAGYEVVAPDMLGHGYSSVPNCPKAYTFSNLLKDALAIFDKYINGTELDQCIVIGHSFGCSLASAVARYREQQIVQLVLISGGGPTPLAPPVPSTEVSDFSCMQVFMKPLLFCGIKRTMFYSSRGKHFDVCDTKGGVPPYVLRYIAEGQNWPEGDAAFHRRILIPTLLVHGLQDSCVTLVQECEMERTIPRSFLEVISTAGHMAMLETPEQLCHMLLCFFQWWSK